MLLQNKHPVLVMRNAVIQQRGFPVLKNVNMTVKPKEIVYLVGKTGSGKTSLLKTIYGEIPLLEGEAIVNGFYLHKLKRKEIPALRKNLGIVFQDFRLLLDRSVYDNLDFVLKATGWKDKNKRKNRIETVLEQTGMLSKALNPAYALSGGEQQRVAIARALLNNPPLLLADEPTGNLDPDTKFEIMELFKEINSWGKTIITATHDYSMLVKYPGRTFMCDNASVYEVEID